MDPDTIPATIRTQEEAKARVLADYRAIAGKTVLASTVMGYFDSSSYEERHFDPPIAVVVSPRMCDVDLLQDHGGWIDPVYDVVAVNASDLPPTSGAWIDGRPWSYDGENEPWQPSGIILPNDGASP